MNDGTVEADSAAIARAGTLVRDGAVVAFPTETLYGLAVDVSNMSALERLVRVKGRSLSQPFPVLVGDEEMLLEMVSGTIPALARQLIGLHWPGPLTLVLPARPSLPGQVVGRSGGVGVRISSDPVARALVREVGRPITATSANRSGEPPATTATQARLPGVEIALDDGPRSAEPSTVVAFLGDPVVLRQGAIKVEVE
jgi:L-threonylcarbamoyladenylate synthase